MWKGAVDALVRPTLRPSHGISFQMHVLSPLTHDRDTEAVSCENGWQASLCALSASRGSVFPQGPHLTLSQKQRTPVDTDL